MIKNIIAIVVIIVSVGVFIYTWKTKVSDFEIDYTKIKFEAATAEVKEKSVSDCIAEAVNDAKLTGKTRATETHFNFYCRCEKKNVVDENDMKDVIAVRQNCLNWTEKFFDQPNLFSK